MLPTQLEINKTVPYSEVRNFVQLAEGASSPIPLVLAYGTQLLFLCYTAYELWNPFHPSESHPASYSSWNRLDERRAELRLSHHLPGGV